MDVPKPSIETVLDPDKRNEYLSEWKRLFQSLDPNIQVLLYTDEKTFNEQLQICYRNTGIPSDFSGYCYEEARILIIVPAEFDLQYLVGLTDDRMFSYHDALADPLPYEDSQYDCEPREETWETKYIALTNIIKRIRSNIPAPPTEPT